MASQGKNLCYSTDSLLSSEPSLHSFLTLSLSLSVSLSASCSRSYSLRSFFQKHLSDGIACVDPPSLVNLCPHRPPSQEPTNPPLPLLVTNIPSSHCLPLFLSPSFSLLESWILLRHKRMLLERFIEM